MAVEAKRGCGYRKVGGLYLVGGGVSAPCGKLPLPLTVCPTCYTGIKQSRGWTWIDPSELFCDIACSIGLDAPAARADIAQQKYGLSCETCPLGNIDDLMRAGLLWIGKQHYPTPEHFMIEGATLGFSRRINAIPNDFVLGETWIFLAHPEINVDLFGYHGDKENGPTGAPGVFRVWRPTHIEKIVTESQAKDADEMARLESRGITPVVVPDNDKDHQ